MTTDDNNQKPEYPDRTVPTIFSDGVQAIANSPHIVKFYLAQQNPSINAVGTSDLATIAQIAMPLDAFVSSIVFLQQGLERMVETGFVSAEMIATAKEALVKTPT